MRKTYKGEGVFELYLRPKEREGWGDNFHIKVREQCYWRKKAKLPWLYVRRHVLFGYMPACVQLFGRLLPKQICWSRRNR